MPDAAISITVFDPTHVTFTMGGLVYTKLGDTIYKDVNFRTPGTAPAVGTFDGVSKILLTEWPAGTTPVVTPGYAAQSAPVGSLATGTDRATFRTASAPLVPGGFNVLGTLVDGTNFNVTADIDHGDINDSGVIGKVNYQTGVVELRFGTPIDDEEDADDPDAVIDVSYLGVEGVTLIEATTVFPDTLRYNAVAYSYIPLDASILGLDPVRLPADGRVPIFRPGTVAVVHHAKTSAEMTVTNGQTVNLGRVRLSRVRVFNDAGALIVDGYTTNLNAGTITFTDVSGYDQPITIEDRIEDAALVSDAQISGLLRFTRPMTHDYPEGSKVSSALLIGDMFARVSELFDQVTWTNVWSDDQIGADANGTYDEINYPPQVENESAVTERWSLIFTGSTAYRIVGEHFGQIGVGNTADDCEPLNPATDQPYFRLLQGGFGSGWATGNVLRLNTVGAQAPVWIARVVLQGEPTELEDSFTLLVRGDVDTP